MISLLISLLVLLIIVYAAHLVIDALGLPEHIRKIAYLIVGLVALLSVLNHLGFIAGNYPLLR